MNIKYPIENAYSMSVEQVLNALQTDITLGISTPEAEKRNNIFGLNIYHAQRQKSIWLILIQQFKSPIVYLLVFGASISLFFADYMEAMAILVVILINAMIGFFMQLQARSSMNALKKMDVILSRVIRDGKVIEIPSEKLSPGDIILLEAGDVIPGDGRLVEVNQLQAEESTLTGESLPSEKNVEELPKDTSLGDQLNMVFKATSIMNGTGKAVITGIASHTQLGTITSLVESSAETITPLDKKLNDLSKKLIWVMLIMTCIFMVTGVIQGKNWPLIIETAIALAVAAFPEGLPIVSTIALAYGMLLMARRNVIVKNLSAVETLGSTNVILTDKTGTLTENKIHIGTLCFPEEKIEVKIANGILRFDNWQIIKSKENFEKLILIGTLCNNASIKTENKKRKESGDPIEIALIHLANASSASFETLKERYARLAEEPFSSDTKIMGTLHKSLKGNLVTSKGAVEDLLEKCSQIQFGVDIKKLNADKRKSILLESEKMASDGLRVLAFAYREEAEISVDNYLNSLIYVGMVGFLDPPRLDIRNAIMSCKKAGIRIVMITGDHPMTALNIARKTGLIEEEEKVISGKDLPPMNSLSVAWKNKILATSVFARTTPKQKLEIADVYQKAGNIVAMTGDGVNDAPALKKADVGIAMGLRGTQVAKETASIIVKNDSFASIVEAVSHGREIFQNIQKFVIYLFSCNLSEILIVTALGFIAPASTLIPLQILFLNMVTDIFPALAIGLGNGDKTLMEKPPRDAKKSIITRKNWVAILLYSLAMTLCVIVAVIYCRQTISSNSQITNNVAFITLAFAQLFHVFNMSSPHSRLVINDITTNKFIWMALFICTFLMLIIFVFPQTRLVLNLAILPIRVWIVAIVASLLPTVLIQTYKIIWERKISPVINTSNT